MKSIKFLTAILFSIALAACGGGSSSGGGGTTTSTVRGVVADNSTGLPIVGATVTLGTKIAMTDANGSYTITGVPATSHAVVNISAPNFAQGSKVTALFGNDTSRADAALLPVAYTSSVSPSTATTLTVPGSNASVTLPANGLKTALGAAPSGNVTVSITPIDPGSNPQIMPGDYSNSTGGHIETFGGLNVKLQDAAGSDLNLAAGSSSTIRIPVSAAATVPPSSMSAWYYDATVGQWVSSGTLALLGTAPNQYYEGTVTQLTTLNAGQNLTTTCITGTVLNSNGTPAANARVDAEGQGYIGTSTAYSAANGSFSINVKAGAYSLLTARTAIAQSNTVSVLAGAAGSACTPMSSYLTLSSTTGSATIKLTWGANPQDLDSHLTGPIAGSTSRFHVYFSNKGSLTAAPNAQLDVDNTSGFGPEIITISSFIPGVYRYSVHHYSGLGTILSSPARVELTLNGVTRVFNPPVVTYAGSGDVWGVIELAVDSAGNVTVTPINTYTAGVMSSSVLSATPTHRKPPMLGGKW